MSSQLNIAIIIPCLNEEITIEKVIRDFLSEVDGAKIFVIDNGSADNTVEIATRTGASVIHENKKGKGNALRRAFSYIDADLFIMVDGDGTYDPKYAPKMIQHLTQNNLDMVVAAREHSSPTAYRGGHKLGNKLFNLLFEFFFGKQFSDIFSGYRVLSAPFVKSFPALSSGFEIETEISAHAINLKLPTAEIKTPYFPRPENSNSKLNTYKDGFIIFLKMFAIFRINRPFVFYGSISFLLFTTSIIMMAPILTTYFGTGLVPRLPTLIVAVGCIIMSALLSVVGLVLKTMVEFQDENRRLAYLSIKRTLNKK